MNVHDNIFHNYKDHNPFWSARSPSYLERRNQLFYTLKRRTPGTISKLSVTLIVFLGLYGMHVMKKTRKEKDYHCIINYEYQRKSAPFLQAVEDRRYLAIEQRKDWMLEELFKENHEEFLLLNRLYNDPTVWLEPFQRTSIFLGNVPKHYKGALRANMNFLMGNDSYDRLVPNTHF